MFSPDLDFASHVWSAISQVLATATLPKVVDLLPKTRGSGFCTHNSPSVASIGALVPEQHASMTTALKHLKPQTISPSAKMLDSLAIAPTMQAIVVNCVPIIDPQLAPIIRDDAESVMPSLSDFQGACPAHSKVITSGKAGPFPVRVAIVHHLAMHVGPGTPQLRTPIHPPHNHRP